MLLQKRVKRRTGNNFINLEALFYLVYGIVRRGNRSDHWREGIFRDSFITLVFSWQENL
jgi:hypothetical protein